MTHSCAPAQPTPSTFSAGFARHLLMMAFASTAWHSPICLWQETIGKTSGTQSATSGSCLCHCPVRRQDTGQFFLLRGLCPNLLMPGPGATAQMRSRTWRLQFWLARGGETDAVSVPSSLLYDCVIYTTILLFYCSHILLYRFHITLVAQYCVCHVSILLVLLKYFFFYCSQREEQVRLTA